MYSIIKWNVLATLKNKIVYALLLAIMIILGLDIYSMISFLDIKGDEIQFVDILYRAIGGVGSANILLEYIMWILLQAILVILCNQVVLSDFYSMVLTRLYNRTGLILGRLISLAILVCVYTLTLYILVAIIFSISNDLIGLKFGISLVSEEVIGSYFLLSSGMICLVFIIESIQIIIKKSFVVYMGCFLLFVSLGLVCLEGRIPRIFSPIMYGSINYLKVNNYNIYESIGLNILVGLVFLVISITLNRRYNYPLFNKE
ncbi:MAG: hypothetical protein RR840_09015 [Clostridium sp.]